MNKRFDIHEWQAKQRLTEEKYNGLPIRDNVMDYASEILNQINDYENNVGPGEVRIDYSGTREAVRALMDAIDRDEEDMDTIARKAMSEHHAGDYNPGFLKQSVNTFLDKLKKKTNEGPDYETVEKIMEKHFSAKKKNENVTEALNPEVSQKVNAFIKAMAKRYDYSEQDAVFAIMAALKQRKTDEASTTGTGASFTPGTGAAYATPRAFGDNKRKKKKGYMGYKEI